jgi:hypothetical protein
LVVPEWFYKRFCNDDERDFNDTAEGHRVRLGQHRPLPLVGRSGRPANCPSQAESVEPLRVLVT